LPFECNLQRYSVGNASPPLNELVAKELLEFAKHEVNIGSIKSSIARLQRLAGGFDKISGAMTYALSWWGSAR
jgi:hypothetical protein